ncbi:ecotin family protein [Campylobacter corcagiensis]|uniref:Ecotin family protein n=1 Tax=Campylobacter corcagiensis TaxID=1448857 RepID=A0A7M1LGB1_9BACT|nr:ecotin family protein [Campylobacter corcagiensis]QKF64173.1 putative serine protease inhibitor, Ecotin family [Campylobacter corcagiensis]QOQ87632.1 ecotin family protein [Campylobacter corcagiensis]
MRSVLGILVMASLAFGFDTSIFPKAQDGFRQHIINLEPKQSEKDYEVVVEFGRVLSVDCNVHSYSGGILKDKVLDGYGYNYYEFSDNNSTLYKTLMLCPDEALKDEFVMFGDSIKTHYNSKIPLIIYAPKDINIRVKIYALESEKIL